MKRLKTFSALALCTALALFIIPLYCFAAEDPGTVDPEPTTTTSTTTTTTTTTTTKETTTTTKETTTKKTTTTKETTSKTTTTKTSKTTTVKKSLSFKSDNKKKVEVTKSIVLYITSGGISDLDTEFASSDTTVASVLKINDSSVRVFGLADGKATITASSNGLTAKWKITVGEGPATSPTPTTPPSMESEVESIPEHVLEIVSDIDPDDKDDEKKVISRISDEELYGLDKIQHNTSPVSTILGVVWWGIMIVGIGFVTLLILQNNAGSIKLSSASLSNYKFRSGKKYNSYSYSSRGSVRSKNRRRKSNTRTRLLPDYYYRTLKKW